MRHYDEDGWVVRDTRVGNPYDAVAEKPGHVRYLEAKGTTSAGASVIVTRGEVKWARQHPGECVIGILSDVRFLPGGDVDPDSGIFRIYDWNPDAGQLVPLDFDWTPTDGRLLDRRSRVETPRWWPAHPISGFRVTKSGSPPKPPGLRRCLHL